MKESRQLPALKISRYQYSTDFSAMFADFLKIVQKLVLGLLDAFGGGLEILVSQLDADEVPALLHAGYAGAAGSHETVDHGPPPVGIFGSEPEAARPASLSGGAFALC